MTRATPQGLDWARLRSAARAAAARAYAPYSGLALGAAALVEDGRTVVGCNVENASFGLTLCAECGLVGELHASGGGRLVAITCVDTGGRAVPPCGRCRQVLAEHAGGDLLVDAPGGPLPLSELLPLPFGPQALPSDPQARL